MQHGDKLTPRSVLMPTRGVCRRYNVCSRTVHRWAHRRDLGFPQPILINGRNYYSLQMLEQWERRRARPMAQVEAAP